MKIQAEQTAEGTLRTITNLSGSRLELAYSDAYGYHIQSRFTWFVRRLASIELGCAMIETLSMATDAEIKDVINAVRTEYQRLRYRSFLSSANKEWAIINGALNRVEGKRVMITGRHKEIETWV